MKLKPLTRQFTMRAEDIDAGARTVRMSFSSEAPVERWFGTEILDHAPGSARLDRLNNGANLLFNHRADDVLGVVENAEIRKDKRGYATVRFAKTARGDEVLSMVQDGILRNVSFQYIVHEFRENTKEQAYRAVDWEPVELTIATVPADQSVGIGRALEGEGAEVKVTKDDPPDDPKHIPEATKPAPSGLFLRSAQPAATPKGAQMDDVTPAAGNLAEDKVQVTEDNESRESLQKLRARELLRMGRHYEIDMEIVQRWIDADTNLNAARAEIKDIIEKRTRVEPKSVGHLGMSQGETKRYSLLRMVRAVANKNYNDAGLEVEASREIAKRIPGHQADPNRFYVPLEVQGRTFDMSGLQRTLDLFGGGSPALRQTLQRDLTVAAVASAGYLVGTDNVGFIEMLRNRSVCFRLGARRLSGLVGNLTIPRQTGAATAQWLTSESTAITESDQVLAQLALSPKTVGAYTEISRQLTLQSSPDAEAMVTADLAAVVAIAVDKAGLEGTGATGQPTGISATSGIGSVTGTTLAAAGIIEFMSDVAAANVTPVRPGYVTTPAVAGALMVKPELPTTGTSRLWMGNIWDGSLFGITAMSSQQLTAATMIFGDWDSLVIAEWGVLEVEVNPYANFPAGIIGVRAMYSVDVGVRHPAAFSRATTIT